MMIEKIMMIIKILKNPICFMKFLIMISIKVLTGYQDGAK